MKIWGLRPTDDVLAGAAVGAGVLVAPAILPLAWSAVRPTMKAILKCGFLLYETGRQAVSEVAQEPTRARAKGTKTDKELTQRQNKREDEEAVIGKVRTAEERAIGGRSRPRQPSKKAKKEVVRKSRRSLAPPA